MASVGSGPHLPTHIPPTFQLAETFIFLHPPVLGLSPSSSPSPQAADAPGNNLGAALEQDFRTGPSLPQDNSTLSLVPSYPRQNPITATATSKNEIAGPAIHSVCGRQLRCQLRRQQRCQLDTEDWGNVWKWMNKLVSLINKVTVSIILTLPSAWILC